MKKTLLYTGLLSLVLSTATAQDDVYPAPKQNKKTAIKRFSLLLTHFTERFLFFFPEKFVAVKA